MRTAGLVKGEAVRGVRSRLGSGAFSHMTGHCIHREQGTSMVPATEATLREQQWGYYKDTGSRGCSQNQGAAGTSMPALCPHQHPPTWPPLSPCSEL